MNIITLIDEGGMEQALNFTYYYLDEGNNLKYSRFETQREEATRTGCLGFSPFLSFVIFLGDYEPSGDFGFQLHSLKSITHCPVLLNLIRNQNE